MGVSIRAPAWGATLPLLALNHAKLVSIRAPAWGATFRAEFQQQKCQCFNPRSRVGSDAVLQAHLSAGNMFQSALPRGERLTVTTAFIAAVVSIRAPAWGATTYMPKPDLDTTFQSALPRGERL